MDEGKRKYPGIIRPGYIDYIKSIPLSSFTPEDGVLLRMERMSLDVKKYPAKKGEYPLALKFTFNNGAYTYENTITYTFE